MNLDFASFGTAGREPAPAQPDYFRLIAAIATAQAATRTAAIEARLGAVRPRCDTPVDALGTLIEARPGWTTAVAALGGCFHPGIARHLAPKRDEAG